MKELKLMISEEVVGKLLDISNAYNYGPEKIDGKLEDILNSFNISVLNQLASARSTLSTSQLGIFINRGGELSLRVVGGFSEKPVKKKEETITEFEISSDKITEISEEDKELLPLYEEYREKLAGAKDYPSFEEWKEYRAYDAYVEEVGGSDAATFKEWKVLIGVYKDYVEAVGLANAVEFIDWLDTK